MSKLEEIPQNELVLLGQEFMSRVRDGSGLETDEEVRKVFDYVVSSFVKKIPVKPTPSMSEVTLAFKKALPSLTTSTCVFLEQVKAFSESVWK